MIQFQAVEHCGGKTCFCGFFHIDFIGCDDFSFGGINSICHCLKPSVFFFGGSGCQFPGCIFCVCAQCFQHLFHFCLIHKSYLHWILIQYSRNIAYIFQVSIFEPDRGLFFHKKNALSQAAGVVKSENQLFLEIDIPFPIDFGNGDILEAIFNHLIKISFVFS